MPTLWCNYSNSQHNLNGEPLHQSQACAKSQVHTNICNHMQTWPILPLLLCLTYVKAAIHLLLEWSHTHTHEHSHTYIHTQSLSGPLMTFKCSSVFSSQSYSSWLTEGGEGSACVVRCTTLNSWSVIIFFDIQNYMLICWYFVNILVCDVKAANSEFMFIVNISKLHTRWWYCLFLLPSCAKFRKCLVIYQAKCQDCHSCNQERV